MIAARAASDAEAAAFGWLLGFSADAACLYWLALPMLDTAGMSPVVVLPLLLALYAFLACYAALAVFAARTFIRVFAVRNRAGGPEGLLRAAAPPLLSGAAYGGFEVLNSVLFSGFPWLTLSSAFAFSPVMLQGAAYAGGYAVSALYAMSACLACAAVTGTCPADDRVPRGRPPSGTGRERAVLACAALMIPAALFVVGARRLGSDTEDGRNGGSQMRLRFIAVQGNIDQSRKWDGEFQRATVEHYIRLSETALAEETGRRAERVDDAAQPREDDPAAEAARRPQNETVLVVWPETAMPFHFSRRPELDAPLRRFAVRHAVNLSFGSIAPDTDGNGGPLLHNSLFMLSPAGRITGRYDKTHLVPFGEYVPVVDDIPFLRGLLQGMSFSPGVAPRPLTVDGKSPLSLGPLICYEAVFPYPAQEQVRQGAAVLLNVSNDAWFGKTSAPLQHLAHSAVRAVEQARPLIRATNTGISAVFDARGRLTARSGRLFTEDRLAGEVAAGEERTPYHRLHPLPELLLGVAAAAALVPGVVRRIPLPGRRGASGRHRS
jgi:apolipoprotein N-acyltransferase